MHMVPILRPPVEKILRRFQKRFPRDNLNRIINLPSIASPTERRRIPNATDGSECTTPVRSTKFVAISVKSLLASISIPNSKSIISYISTFVPSNCTRTEVAVKCWSSNNKCAGIQEQSCSPLCLPNFSQWTAGHTLSIPRPLPPVGVPECRVTPFAFTKIASTRVGCPPTAILITRSFSRVKVL